MAIGFGDVLRNIVRSVKMGSTAGLGSSERRASRLSRAGYSESEIKGYEDRTAATREKRKQREDLERSERSERNRKQRDKQPDKPKADVPVTPMPTKPVPTPVTPMPPAPPELVDLATPPASEVETAAIESTRGGRASTILTGAQGLLAEQEPAGQLRRRRSLMGGGLIQ
jgi:hypothetical protein